MPRPSRVSPALWIWLSARQLSEIGTSLNTIVISVYALALFDNPAVLGLILALRMGGSVVGALLAPILSRRLSHRTILVASDFANCALMLALALGPAVLAPDAHSGPAVLHGPVQGYLPRRPLHPGAAVSRTRVPPPDERHSGIHGRDRDGGGRHPGRGPLRSRSGEFDLFHRWRHLPPVRLGIPGPGRTKRGTRRRPPPPGRNVRRPGA